MPVEVIPMLINSDFMEVSLDVLMYIADYKMYGESSFVYQDKSKLHKIYEASNISMNDSKVNGEAFEYLLKSQSAGKILATIHELERKEEVEKLSTMTAIANNSTAMTAVLNSPIAMAAVVNSSTAMAAVANNSTAMTAVLNNPIAMAAVVNSSIAMAAVANNSTAMTAILNNSTSMTAVLNSTIAMTAVVNSSTAMAAVANNSTAMTAIAYNSTLMTAILNSPNCMLLKDTGLSGAAGGICNGKFLLVGSTTISSCLDSCAPNYTNPLNANSRLTLNSTRFGIVYTKIGIPGVPVTTIFTMLDDFAIGEYCVVYKF